MSGPRFLGVFEEVQFTLSKRPGQAYLSIKNDQDEVIARWDPAIKSVTFTTEVPCRHRHRPSWWWERLIERLVGWRLADD